MKLVIDVHYFDDDTAVAAGLLFPNWQSSNATQSQIKTIYDIKPYESGAFYKRELPCILNLLNEINETISIIIIDGYVVLGKAQSPGLGHYLYHHLNKQIPVIGVAKKAFKDTPKECEIFRGKSLNPLYITSAGIELDKAKAYILQMDGKYRIPTLLKNVDQLCRGKP